MSFLLRNIGDVQKVFEEIKTSIFYITPNADKAVGLEKIIGNYHIICIDYDDEVDYLEKLGVNVFCLEKEMGKKNVLFRNSGLLLQRSEVIEYITHLRRKIPLNPPLQKGETGGFLEKSSLHPCNSHINSQRPAITVFKPSLTIERICRENNWLLLNNSVSISQQFEDKLNFYKIAHKLNLPIPKTREIDINKSSYRELKSEFGHFVIQHPSGFAGRTTFFIKSKDDYLRFKEQYKGDKIKTSEFIDGLPITINACVTKFGTVVGEPCYQITGISVCTNNPATTCGNDWRILRKNFQFSIFNFQLIYKKIEEITKTVGDYMAKTGYKGIFGLDFVLEEKSGRIYLIECNPRIVASIPMATKLEIAQGQIPLLIFHILEFLKLDYKIPDTPPLLKLRRASKYQILNTNINGFQLVLRNKNSKKCIVKGNFKSGIYKFASKGLKFVRKGYSVEDIKARGEFVILSVSKGRLLNPETECARIESKESLLDSNYRLKKQVEIVVKELYQRLKFALYETVQGCHCEKS